MPIRNKETEASEGFVPTPRVTCRSIFPSQLLFFITILQAKVVGKIFDTKEFIVTFTNVIMVSYLYS